MNEPSAWSTEGIAFAGLSFAKQDILTAANQIRNGATAEATETIGTAIRQLEAARRMLTGGASGHSNTTPHRSPM